MKKILKCMVKVNTVPAKSHINLFDQLAFIMQVWEINLNHVFIFPLGLYEWNYVEWWEIDLHVIKMYKSWRWRTKKACCCGNCLQGSCSKTCKRFSVSALKTVLTCWLASVTIHSVSDVYGEECQATQAWWWGSCVPPNLCRNTKSEAV